MLLIKKKAFSFLLWVLCVCVCWDALYLLFCVRLVLLSHFLLRFGEKWIRKRRFHRIFVVAFQPKINANKNNALRMKFDVADQVENIGERLPFLCLIHSLLFWKWQKEPNKQTKEKDVSSFELQHCFYIYYSWNSTAPPKSRAVYHGIRSCSIYRADTQPK